MTKHDTTTDRPEKRIPTRITSQEAAQIFHNHYSYVESIAFRMMPIASLQHDIVHDAFVVFVEKAESWKVYDDVRPLLRQITANIVKRYWADQKRSLPDSFRQLYELWSLVGKRVFCSRSGVTPLRTDQGVEFLP